MKIAKMYNRRIKVLAEKMVTRRPTWSNSVKSTSFHTPPLHLHWVFSCSVSVFLLHLSVTLWPALLLTSQYLCLPLIVKVFLLYSISNECLLHSCHYFCLQLLLLNHINKCHVHANCLLLWFYGQIAIKCVRAAVALTWLWGLCSAYM